MRNILGNNLTLTLFGESHGPYVGATLDGLSAGIKIDYELIHRQLAARRPQNKFETSRIELDEYEIISGVFDGYTTGSPLTILIPNNNTKSYDYEQFKKVPRPSHADYVAEVKYRGFQDYRGGGHFSGRITAAIVVAGAIVMKALEELGIYIGTHILECAGIKDRHFSGSLEEVLHLNNQKFPVLDDLEKELQEKLEMIASTKDSVGGLLETIILGVPVGLGEPWFSSVEGLIANAVFGIGGIKGIAFGKGFDYKDALGSQVNDEFRFVDGEVQTSTNNNGGINGGITNGMPVVFTTVVKPTPSISQEQNTINLNNYENTKLTIQGRHDPAIIRRVAVVLNSVTALVVADMMLIKYGQDVLGE